MMDLTLPQRSAAIRDHCACMKRTQEHEYRLPPIHYRLWHYRVTNRLAHFCDEVSVGP